MEVLTEREIELLGYIALGYENSEISKLMYISIHTVKAYIAMILKKLKARNRTNAIYIAVKLKLIN